MNESRVCPVCDGTGWVERRDDVGYVGHVTMVRCPDPAGVHEAAEVARLARISGLLPEEQRTIFGIFCRPS